MTGTPTTRITELPVRWIRDHMHDALEIYGRAMGYDSSVVAGRYGYAIAHTERPGFRAVGAFAPAGADGAERLVGFGYGYVVAPGQWWHDQVRAALDRRTAKRWLPGAFEVCELHVHPDHQSRGTGRALLHALVADLPHPAALLSTPDADTKAFRLYHADGFVDLARGYHFPGDARPFAILGARLPLRANSGAAGGEPGHAPVDPATA